MTPEQWEKVGELFEAVENLDAAECRKFLNSLQIDDVIRNEVLSLADASRGSQNFLKNSPAKNLATSLRDKQLPLPELEASEKVCGFEIVSLLGKGASAAVYLARDSALDRMVALKISHAQGTEAQMMAKLEHDCIVRVFSEVREQNRNLHIICMQYIQGPTLQELCSLLSGEDEKKLDGETLFEAIDSRARNRGQVVPFDLGRREFVANLDEVELVAWFGAALAEALAFAHAQGVLHFDIKPANILIDDTGRPFLTDFSISRSTTQTSTFGGTLGFMSPEHAAAFRSGKAEDIANLDARADIFSLGVVLRILFESGADRVFSPAAYSISQAIHLAEKEPRELRPSSAVEFGKRFQSALLLRQMEKKLPEPGPLLRRAAKSPIAYTLCLSVLPQIVGSIVNITYNMTAIVSRLSEAQQIAFHQVTVVYNLMVYPLCVGLFFYAVFPLRKVNTVDDAESCTRMRAKVLQLPVLIFWMTTIGWLPGIVAFPAGISHLTSPLDPEIYAHFFASFFLSWMMSFAYSALFMRDMVTRFFYPRLLICESDIAKVARRELTPVIARTRFTQIVAIAIPLFAAALMILVGPEKFETGHYDIFRLLVVLVLSIGFVSLFFVNATVDKILAAIWTFSRTKK